jgi:hypothetical protein
MRWLRAGTGVLSLLMMTGCPSEFGMEGRIDKAVHKDAIELVRKHCTADRREQVCGGGKEKTQRCIEECGG